MTAGTATTPEQTDTKERLLLAAEQLFANEGIHAVPIRKINELAGQRNPSALHYHFGSRDGLVAAILLRHQGEVEIEVRTGLDALAADPAASVNDLVTAAVRPLAAKLQSPSGRNFLRIIPQVLSLVSANLRRGASHPIPVQSRRLLELFADHMAHLPEAVRTERLVTYSVVLAGLLAERAHHLESGASPLLDHEQFVAHLIDTVAAVLTAPSNVPS